MKQRKYRSRCINYYNARGSSYEKKILICICLLFFVGIIIAGIALFRTQYSEKGISKYLCIEIDQSGWKEIGQVDNVKIMTYNLKMPYFICSNANEINLDTALQQGDIQVKDLYEYADVLTDIDVDGEKGTSYLYENYQVVMVKEKCIVAPKNVDFIK